MSWFVVGGIAVGAVAGAAVGSKKGGDDVWKGALIGGAIGGTAGYAAAPAAAGAAPAAGAAVVPEAAGAVGGAGAFGGTGAATVGATGGFAPAGAGILGAEGAAAGGAGTAGILSSGQLAGGAAGSSAFTAGGAGAGGSTGIMGGTSGIGSGLTAGTTAGAPSIASGSAGFTGSSAAAAPSFAPGMQAPVQMVSAPATSEFAQVEATPMGDKINGVQTAANPTGYTPAPQQSALERGFGSAMSWLSEPKNAMLTGVLGLGALSMFNDDQAEFGNQPVTQAGYSLSPDFKPTRVNPQQYRYRSSYAEGGLTDLDVGMREMYARQAADPVTMMASGGIAGYARGGSTRKQMAMIDPRTQETPAAPAPSYVGSAGIYSDDDADTRTQDALAAAQTRMAKTAKRANVRLGTMQKAKPIDEIELEPVPLKEEKMASGGISSLGGYAHGGNARLLRGPGDGMSDDIPASIADKQPARLADGEFVVPADVVSGLGNGSTEAGAKKLHKMMDKVRVDRTGTKKQGREIKAEKYIPGMAAGGIASYADGGDIDLSQYYVYDAYGNQVPMSALQSAVNQQTPAGAAEVSSDLKRTMVDPGQFALGGQYTPDYAVPGYTLTGNLGRWSNVAGEEERAARQPSLNQQVTQAYLNTLGRAPDQLGFNRYMESGMTAPQIQRELLLSPEATQTNPSLYGQDYISNLYQTNLGRPPEQSGADFWMSQLQNRGTPQQIAAAIQNSPEAQAYQQATQAALAQAQTGQAPAAEATPAAATTAKRGGILAVKKGR